MTRIGQTKTMLRYFILYWVPVVLWMAAIFYGSSSTSHPGPLSWPSPEGFILRKATHMVEYAGLFVLLQRALAVTRPTSSQGASRAGGEGTSTRRALPFLQAFAAAFLFALSDELHQSFVPQRGAQLLDVGWDMLGAAFGLVAVLLGNLLCRVIQERIAPP